MKTKKEPNNPLLDFRNFLFMVWQHLNLPDPTPVQYDMAEYLQDAPKRAVIEALLQHLFAGNYYLIMKLKFWLFLLVKLDQMTFLLLLKD